MTGKRRRGQKEDGKSRDPACRRLRARHKPRHSFSDPDFSDSLYESSTKRRAKSRRASRPRNNDEDPVQKQLFPEEDGSHVGKFSVTNEIEEGKPTEEALPEAKDQMTDLNGKIDHS